MTVYYKYMKYKEKYLNLKRMFQVGGGSFKEEKVDKNDIKAFLLDDPKNEKKTTYDFSDNIIKYKYESKEVIDFLKIDFKNKDKPTLVVVPGMSHSSFKNTSIVVLENLEIIRSDFSSIIFIDCNSYKKDQSKACEIREDEFKKTGTRSYAYEEKLNTKIADNIHNILKMKLKLDNVCLLGKCNGGWISSILLAKDDIYTGLILGVPGIPPKYIKINSISKERLSKIKFIFCWRELDNYNFTWDVKSNKEMKNYKEFMEKNLPGVKYSSILIPASEETEDKSESYHEISKRMIEYIHGNL